MRVFLHDPEPAYAPVRDLSYKTELKEVIRVARGIGWTLMPWQKRVVEVATEYRTDAFGIRHYKYHDVVVTVPRQSGKTTVVGPVILHRLLMLKAASTFYTAQNGLAARHRIKDMVGTYANSVFGSVLKPNMEAGAEGVVNLASGSFLRRFSPTPTALHGETPRLVVVDEFWKFTAMEGDNLTGAINPGQITIRSQSQTWWISTMGTADSAFMNGIVEAGRAGVDPRTAYFEWSLPEGLDPSDPENWGFHPALGNTISTSDLQDEHNKLRKSDKMGEWLRAYCNRKTGTANPLISEAAWAGMQTEMVKPDEWVLSYEVAPGNALAAVCASWRDEDGTPYSYVIKQAAGTAWLPHYVAWCSRHLEPRQIVADDGGPTRRLTERIRAEYRDVEVTTLSMPEFGSACMGWLEAARETGRLRHDGSEPLRQAVMSASLRSVNGVERFSRDEAEHPVAALIGCAVALWGWDSMRAKMELQMFV